MGFDQHSYLMYALQEMCTGNDLYTASVDMVLIDRVDNNTCIPEGDLAELEDMGGYALMRAMKNF